MSAKLHIGDVEVFFTGGRDPMEWGLPVSGGERVSVLREMFLNRKAADCYSVIKFAPYKDLTWDDIDWESAGAMVTHGRKT
jgi:hypothetical protein